MVKKFRVCFWIFLLAAWLPGYSQSNNVPHSRAYYHLLDRYEIKSGQLSSQVHTSFKPVQAKAVAEFAKTLSDSLLRPSSRKGFNLQFLARDNWEWLQDSTADSLYGLRFFHPEIPDALSLHTKGLKLRINPVLELQADKEQLERKPYFFGRGVELKGNAYSRLGFYAFLSRNQTRPPAYVRSRVAHTQAVPGERYWTGHGEDGLNFLTARANLSFNATRHINFQLGQDCFFIGNGTRSMILSDFGASYPFVKIQTQLWRFSYTNLFASLNGHFPGAGFNPGQDYFAKKFLALHHLSLNITDNVNIGLFEAIVSGDSVLGGFELEYLNPVIFYRAVEHNINNSTTGNAILGMDAKWNAAKHIQIYGQFVLDEFLIKHLREATGWWANKWASQLGIKYVDALNIKNLDLLFEWNRARPFMYAHQTHYTSYTHYSQPLAHPLGANFNEQLMILRYQPLNRLNLEAQFMQANYGTDSLGISFGGNVLRSYNRRDRTFGHFIGQGVATKLQMAQLRTSYMLTHRMFIDLSNTVRFFRQSNKPRHVDVLLSAGLRWNIARRDHLF